MKSPIVAIQLIQMALQLIPIITAIIILTYLGVWINNTEDHEIDPNDWRRKWLVLFAWLLIVSVVLNVLLGITIVIK